ncbi:MAG: PAS domain S-box protein, partial [Gammaproteobacteria bacterium]
MQLPDIRTALLRRIIFLALLIIMSAALITGTIYLEERLPGPLLDKSINFHSVIMRDTNKLTLYLNSVLYDIEHGNAATTSLQQIADAGYALNNFSSRLKQLYQNYEFKPGLKTLTELRKNSDQLQLLIRQAPEIQTADLPPLLQQIQVVTDRLQQLYRLHESEDNNLREQLVHFQKLRAIIAIPLITAILLLTGFLGFLLIRKILQSFAVQNKLEKELRETGARHQQILDSMYVFVGLMTVDGRLVEMNEAPLKATGLRREDVLGVEIWETYALAYSQESKDMIKSLVSRATSGEIVRQDVKVRIAGDNYIFMDSIFSPVYDSEGRIVNVIGSGVDITARKNIEEELRSNAQRQDFLLSASPAVIYTCRPSGDFAATYITPNFQELFGYSTEEFLHDPAFWTNNIHPEDVSRVVKGFTTLFAHDTLSHQYRFRMPDGSFHWVQDDLRLIRNTDGTPQEIIGSWRDVNPIKYSEELHRQNEERLKEAQRIASLGNWELNLVTNILIWSDEVYRIFEIDKESFNASYESFLNLVHPDDRDRVQTTYENSLKTQSPYEITHRLLMPNGRIKWVTERCQSYFDENGKPLRSVGTLQDITLQYNTRLELQTGRGITDELFANLQGMVYRCRNDPDWTLDFVTEGITPLTGYTPKEFVVDHSIHFGQLIHPEDAGRVWDTVQEGVRQCTAYEIRYRIRTRGGDIKWVAERGHGVYTDDGQLLYLQGLIIDGTQRTQMEQDLQLAHTAINKSRSAFFWINLEGKVIYVNDYACQNLGYTRAELTGMHIWDFDPDFTAADLPPTIAQMKQKGVVVLESRHRRKDGSIFPIEVTANYITFGDESHIFTFVQDISERRQKDSELQQSRTLLSAIIENLPSMVFLKDAHNLKITLLNKAGEDLLGISRKQVLGHSDLDIFPREQAENFIARDQETLRNKTVVDIPEEQITTPNKGTRLLHTRKVGIYDDAQNPRYLLGISEDITEKKQAEDALRASEERYRMLLESQRDGVFVSQDYKFVFANKALPKMLGYTHEEFLGLPFMTIVAPDFLDLWTSRYKQRIGSGPEPPGNYEVRMLRKGGDELWVELQAQRIVYGGSPAIFGVIHDLTERRQAESTRRKFEHIVSGSHNLISFIDRNYRFNVISDAYLKLFNKRREEIVDHTLANLYGEEFFLTYQKGPFD